MRREAHYPPVSWLPLFLGLSALILVLATDERPMDIRSDIPLAAAVTLVVIGFFILLLSGAH